VGPPKQDLEALIVSNDDALNVVYAQGACMSMASQPQTSPHSIVAKGAGRGVFEQEKAMP
jgi:hypothetical protein